MRNVILTIGSLAIVLFMTMPVFCSEKKTEFNKLTAEEHNIIINKGTERPFTGVYNKHYEKGTYTCKQCDQPLFESSAKFDSKTGWPSFDDAIDGAVEEVRDYSRMEIVCSRCKGHLGHVFRGEGFTPKQTRHCVNSLSLNFVPEGGFSKAYFAGGCFWGVEYYLEMIPGVASVTSGFMGGHVVNPSYKEVIRKRSGHVETVEVLYDSTRVNYYDLAKRFFEIHDPTQKNGQGPDIGPQYLSKIFVANDGEKAIVEDLIKQLLRKYRTVATTIEPVAPFYPAEEYHQDYYLKKGGTPYCHSPVNRFD